MNRATEAPHCVTQPCQFTAGYAIGGGKHVCWMHALLIPGACEAISTAGLPVVGLVPSDSAYECPDAPPRCFRHRFLTPTMASATTQIGPPTNTITNQITASTPSASMARHCTTDSDRSNLTRYALGSTFVTMSHETIKIKTGNDPARTMPDTQATMDYVTKLSYAATVRVWFDSGEVWDVECGKRTLVGI